jgi:putative membrane protein
MEFSVAASLNGLPAFLAYLIVAVALTFLYGLVYGAVTSHNELSLIRQDNSAAAIALAGSLIGFVIPLASAIANSVSLGDCIIWGIVALVIQVGSYYLLRIPISDLSGRIEQGQIAAGSWLGSGSLAAGILNAACMTY